MGPHAHVRVPPRTRTGGSSAKEDAHRRWPVRFPSEALSKHGLVRGL